MPRSKFNEKKVKSYSEDDIQNAIKKIESKQMTLRKASFSFKVPYSTVQNRMTREVQTVGSGTSTVLSKVTEELLVHIIKMLAEWGFGLRFPSIQSIVADYLKTTNQTRLFKNGKPGKDWYYHFMNRWSNELSLRKADNISQVRAASCTSDNVDKYFITCRKVFLEAKIDDFKSAFLWNVDETGFCGDQGKSTILVKKGMKRPLLLTGNNEKIHYTKQNCCNAAGLFLPPFIVYKSKNRLFNTWCKGGPDNTVYTSSPSGWMENDQFLQWLEVLFIPEVKKYPGQHILLLDGHSTHVTLKVIEICQKNNVSLLCLPAHSSHILQPLDVGVYCHVKKVWRTILQEYYAT